MKKKPGKYLKFYYDSIEAGMMVPVEGGCARTSGLCDAFGHDELFKVMNPTEEDMNKIYREGKKSFTWGSDSHSYEFHVFTPLRQTIVLLMAAMAGEL